MSSGHGGLRPIPAKVVPGPSSWRGTSLHHASCRAMVQSSPSSRFHSAGVLGITSRAWQLRQPKPEGWTRFVCFSDAQSKDGSFLTKTVRKPRQLRIHTGGMATFLRIIARKQMHTGCKDSEAAAFKTTPPPSLQQPLRFSSTQATSP